MSGKYCGWKFVMGFAGYTCDKLCWLRVQGLDLLDGSHIAGASKGNIEGGGIGGLGQGSIL